MRCHVLGITASIIPISIEVSQEWLSTDIADRNKLATLDNHATLPAHSADCMHCQDNSRQIQHHI